MSSPSESTSTGIGSRFRTYSAGACTITRARYCHVASPALRAIHFLHVRSGQPDAKPLLITHGFPSSVAEFLHLIEPLVNPAADLQAFFAPLR